MGCTLGSEITGTAVLSPVSGYIRITFIAFLRSFSGCNFSQKILQPSCWAAEVQSIYLVIAFVVWLVFGTVVNMIGFKDTWMQLFFRVRMLTVRARLSSSPDQILVSARKPFVILFA